MAHDELHLSHFQLRSIWDVWEDEKTDNESIKKTPFLQIWEREIGGWAVKGGDRKIIGDTDQGVETCR